MKQNNKRTRLGTTLWVVALVSLIQAGSVKAATYYVCSESGDDSHNGLTEATAWQSLDKVNTLEFKPGDRLLFASGSVFFGQLAPMGGGRETIGRITPVMIDRFGEGEPPQINAEGQFNAAIYLHNTEGWEI